MREHLREEVRDVDDRRSAVAESADDLEQLLRLVAGQRRGRLVHDDQLRVARERPQDLDLLLVGDAERPDEASPGESRSRAVSSSSS